MKLGQGGHVRGMVFSLFIHRNHRAELRMDKDRQFFFCGLAEVDRELNHPSADGWDRCKQRAIKSALRAGSVFETNSGACFKFPTIFYFT